MSEASAPSRTNFLLKRKGIPCYALADGVENETEGVDRLALEVQDAVSEEASTKRHSRSTRPPSSPG